MLLSPLQTFLPQVFQFVHLFSCTRHCLCIAVQSMGGLIGLFHMWRQYACTMLQYPFWFTSPVSKAVHQLSIDHALPMHCWCVVYGRSQRLSHTQQQYACTMLWSPFSDPPPVFQFVHLFPRTTHCPCMVGVWCMEGPQGLHIHDNSMHAQCCGPPPTFLSLKSACLKVSVCSPLLVILNTHTHCLQSQKPTLSLTLSPYS